MNQTVRRAPARALSTKAALAVTVVPTLVLLVGIPLHDSAPGSCDAWPECTYSAREQWVWRAGPWVTGGVMLGVFMVAATQVAGWLRARPVAVRRSTVAALCVLGPVTLLFAFVVLAIWNADCSDASWLCFSGPSDALALGSPGFVTGAASVLLVAGLAGRRSPAGRAVSTLTLAALAAGLVAAVSGLVAANVLNLLVDALSA